MSGIVVHGTTDSGQTPDLPVAVKLIPRKTVSERRWKRELEVMRRVQSVHGLVPKLYAWGSGDEQWALAMTLCGPSLASIIGLGRLSMYSTLATVGEQMVRFSLTEPRCQLPDPM